MAAAACALSLAALSACGTLKLGPYTVETKPLDSLETALVSTSVDQALTTGRTLMSPQVGAPVIAQDGVLTVGITPSTLPYTYLDSATNSYRGLDVDVAYALAEELGLTVRFVSVSGSDDALAQGVDVYVATNAVSAPDMRIVGTYEETASAFFRRGSNTVLSAADLEGKTVGVNAGSNSSALLDRLSVSVTKREFDTVNEAFAALDAGTVDYVLADAYMGAYIAHTYSDMSFAGAVGESVPKGIAVSLANQERQTVVEDVFLRMQENGRMTLLRKSWLGDLPVLDQNSQIADVSAQASAVPAEAAPATDASADGSTAGSNAVTLEAATTTE
jgi:polar amino acid transport system substrate-binding protein